MLERTEAHAWISTCLNITLCSILILQYLLDQALGSR